ncbi:MAG: flagellar biosynthesis protein FlhF, partial [Pseudomonadales bacterium]|nr:flagellar biosynthesis protein FlhF [Pseudomonadales bacterium]
MKIRHYRAADMRSALVQVRDAMGPDAIILSSRRTGNEVEVVAGLDAVRGAPVDSTRVSPPG